MIKVKNESGKESIKDNIQRKKMKLCESESKDNLSPSKKINRMTNVKTNVKTKVGENWAEKKPVTSNKQKSKKRKFDESDAESIPTTSSNLADVDTIVSSKANKYKKLKVSSQYSNPSSVTASKIGVKSMSVKQTSVKKVKLFNTIPTCSSDIKKKTKDKDAKKIIKLTVKQKSVGKDGAAAAKVSQKETKTIPSDVKKQKIEEMSFKERKQIRKKQNNNYDYAKTAVRLWEKLRVFDQSMEDRQKVSLELFKLVKGRAVKFINAHDTARVVQTLIKYGTAEQRNTLFDELKCKIMIHRCNRSNGVI